jgi:hypothetical protein
MIKIGRKIAVETGFPPGVHHRSPNQADTDLLHTSNL